MTTTKPELKACPFCGGKAVMQSWHNAAHGTLIDCSNECDVSALGKNKPEAIKKWNTRAPEKYCTGCESSPCQAIDNTPALTEALTWLRTAMSQIQRPVTWDHEKESVMMQTLVSYASKNDVAAVTIDDLSSVINFGIDIKRAEALCHILKNMYPKGLTWA